MSILPMQSQRCIECGDVLADRWRWAFKCPHKCAPCSRPPTISVAHKLEIAMEVAKETGSVDAFFEVLGVPPEPLTADDVRTARLDCDAHGRVFDEVKLAVAAQVLRSICKEQPTASAVIRALAEAALKRIT